MGHPYEEKRREHLCLRCGKYFAIELMQYVFDKKTGKQKLVCDECVKKPETV